MKITNLKIGNQLAIGFAIVLILTMILGIRAIIGMQNLADDIVKIHQHPLAVSNAVRDIRADIIAMHRSMKDVALAKDVGEIATAAAIVDKYEKQVYKSFDLVSQRFLGDKSDVKTALRAFTEWKAIRDEVIRLMEFGEKDKAADITKGKGAKHVDEMNKKIQVMIDFASNKADSFFKNAQEESQWAISIMIILLIVTLITSVIMAILISLSIVNPLTEIVAKIRMVAKGNLNHEIDIYRNDEIGDLARSTYSLIETLAFVVIQINKIADGDYKADIAPRSENDELGVALQKMTETLREVSVQNQEQTWLQTGQTELNEAMRGDLDLISLVRKVITYMAKYLNAQVATLYLYDEENQVLRLTASYAFNSRKGVNNVFKLGEGLVGQAALEQEMISITNVPEDYIRVISGIGYAIPRNIVVTPVVYDNVIKAVIELGSFQELPENKLQFLSIVTESIAINITSAQSRNQMSQLLEQSQRQTEELASQQEELRVINEELEERTQALENNEKSLKEQKEDLEITNKKLEQTRLEIEKKAAELEVSSRYKSEFLANMSHELRTPLNSMLILSEQLAENDEGNLTDAQVESAQIVYQGGKDLLNLINEILDLSKIEAGKMSLNLESVQLSEIANILKINFQPVADKKDLDFHINLAQDLPSIIETDDQRLAQILKNLLSNAFKFTKTGSVTLDFQQNDTKIAIAVIDTGIGIPEKKQLDIFEAFQQVDGSTARKYGGTGLGLSISKELAKLLGGELQLTSSVENEGSRFTLYLPFKRATTEVLPLKKTVISSSDNSPVVAPEYKFQNQKILIVDDDMRNVFALSGALQKNGLDVYKAANGEKALEILESEPSMDLVLMDIMMPVMDGYETMRAIRSKEQFKNLPIIAVTAKAMKEDRAKCLAAGANDYLTKPVDVNQLLSLMRVWLYK